MNVGDEPLHMLVAFNDSASEGSDDIGIGESIAGLPDRVMAAVFGTSVQTFAAIPKPQVKAIIVQPATIEDGCE